MRLQIEPIYGWGWYDQRKGGVTEVPPPFQLEVIVAEPGDPFRVASGRIQAENHHPLSGLWIVLSMRTALGDFNLDVFAEQPTVTKLPGAVPETPILTGFAFAKIID